MAFHPASKFFSWATLGVALAVASGAAANDGGLQTALLEPGEPRDLRAVQLPPMLSEADASRYRVIFRLQAQGAWKASERITAQLRNRILMGHVLAQRYLHPTKYRSRYKELKAWMAKYADHPQARQIYKLALRRRPRNWRMPKPPAVGKRATSERRVRVYRAAEPRKRLDRSQRKKLRQIKRRIRWYLRKGWTKAAKKLLARKDLRELFHPVGHDRERARLGAAYFAAGRDEWALEWAGRAAKRSGKYLPQASWTAGLAAWRLGRFDQSRAYFARVANAERASTWLKSAGAYWAARASLRAGRPQDVNRLLSIASAYSRTFYGLLARRQLGLEVKFDWAPPPLPSDMVEALTAAPGGRRAVTLLSIGEDHRAERELRLLFTRATPELASAMLALADRANMPSLAMRLSDMLLQNGTKFHDSTAYPVPRLALGKIGRVDLALILALIRQESRFNPRAKSHAGARGLMQIMPRTASFLARDRRFRGRKRSALFDPGTNIALGQKYIGILLRDDNVKGDLMRFAMAWNGGPGNLRKWQRRVRHQNDPLLFIESIPLKETRNFVERVLTNYWIYRMRFGLPTPTLDAVAAGGRPIHGLHLDNTAVQVARDEPGNR